MSDAPILAMTGATGFIGRHAMAAFLRAGYFIRALVRRNGRLADVPGYDAARVLEIEGNLFDAQALQELTGPATHILHAAGLVTSLDPIELHKVNVEGTEQLVLAIGQCAEPPKLIHLSSLAARMPELSAYAQSKRHSEAAASAAQAEIVIVRPPAVYGPGDQATLPIFAQLAKGLLIAPKRASARLSLIHVGDLTDLLVDLARSDKNLPAVIEPDDGQDRGYSWPELAVASGQALQRKVRLIKLPRWVFHSVATIAQAVARLTGKRPLLTRDKIAELFHDDWVASSSCNQAALGCAAPRIDVVTGFKTTMDWYRSAGAL